MVFYRLRVFITVALGVGTLAKSHKVRFVSFIVVKVGTMGFIYGIPGRTNPKSSESYFMDRTSFFITNQTGRVIGCIFFGQSERKERHARCNLDFVLLEFFFDLTGFLGQSFTLLVFILDQRIGVQWDSQ